MRYLDEFRDPALARRGLLMEGEAVERIANASFVSVATIRTQVRAILQKLGVNSQLEAVADATRAGWAPPALPLQSP